MTTYFNVFGDKGGILLNDSTPLYYLKSKVLLSSLPKTTISSSNATGYNKSRCIDAVNSNKVKYGDDYIYYQAEFRDVVSYRVTKSETDICVLSMFANMNNVTFTSPNENVIDINFPSSFNKADSVYVYTYCISKNQDDYPSVDCGLEIYNANGIRIFSSVDRDYLKNIHTMGLYHEWTFFNDLTNSSLNEATRKASDYNGIIINSVTHFDSYPCCCAIFETKDCEIYQSLIQVFNGTKVLTTDTKTMGVCKNNNFDTGGPGDNYNYFVYIDRTINQKYQVSAFHLEYNMDFSDANIQDWDGNILDRTHGVTQPTSEAIVIRIASYRPQSERIFTINYYADAPTEEYAYTPSSPVTFTVDKNITVASKSATPGLQSYTVTIKPAKNEIIIVTTNRGTFTSTFTAYYGDTWTASVVANEGYDAGKLNISSGTITDNVSISASDATLSIPDIPAYLTFSSTSDFTLSTYNTTKNWNGTLYYSTDTTNWNEWTGTTTISSNNGKLYLRGVNNTKITGTNKNYRWVLTGSNISCLGNIEILLDYTVVLNGNHPTISTSCYSYMFYGCTSLTTAPELPATTLNDGCYKDMFNGCTRLTTAPELPATTLNDNCYTEMFYGCTRLTTAPKLPATTLAGSCYSFMFSNCTSLTTAPELPATTLTNYCYYSMFSNCTSLTTAPELPATTLAGSCYAYMFQRCTLVTTVHCSSSASGNSEATASKMGKSTLTVYYDL